MGAYAVRAALADAGLAWADVQFAYGGSEDGGNADTMVSELGPTGLPFVNVKNGCATGGSSLVSAVTAIRSGEYDIGLVVGFDKHPRGAFQNDPADWSLPAVVRRGRPDGDDAVLRHEASAIHARSRDPGADARASRREGVRERSAHAARVAAHAAVRRADRVVADAGTPADAIHAVLARARARLRSSSAGASTSTGCADARPVWLRSVAFRTRRAGTFEVFSPALPLEIAPSPSVDAARAGVRGRGRRARRTSTSPRCRTPSPAPS